MCPFICFVNAVFFWNRVDSPPTNSISLTLLHITSRTWSRPRRRRGWRPLGTVAVLSSRHDDLNDCLDVALDVLLPWRSGCSLTKQLLTFCLLHPCSIALSTHQLHHQVFPISNLNALPVPNAKQVPRSFSSHLFLSCFPFAVWRVSGGSLGAFGVVLGSFREPFGCHFGDF